ncbi:hypothetical protein ACIGXA_14800, partial [Streptomyces fildesensis]
MDAPNSSDFGPGNIFALGNAWIDMGQTIQDEATVLYTAVEGIAWTGDARFAAREGIVAVYNNVLFPARTTCWAIGDSINDYGRAIETILAKQQAAANAAGLAEIIGTVLGFVLPLGLGLLAKLIAPLLEGLIAGITSIIKALGAAMQTVIKLAGFIAGVVGGAATQLGVDLLSQWIGDKAYDVPFEIDWKSEGISMGVGGLFGGLTVLPHLYPGGGKVPKGGTVVPEVPVPKPTVPKIPGTAGVGEGGVHQVPVPGEMPPPALRGPGTGGPTPIGGLGPNGPKPVEPILAPGGRPPETTPPRPGPGGGRETPVLNSGNGAPPITPGRSGTPGAPGADAPRTGGDMAGGHGTGHEPGLGIPDGKNAHTPGAGTDQPATPGLGGPGTAPGSGHSANPSPGRGIGENADTHSPAAQRTATPDPASRSVLDPSTSTPGHSAKAPVEPSTSPGGGNRTSESPSAQNYKSSFEQQPKEMGKGLTGDGTSPNVRSGQDPASLNQTNPTSTKSAAAVDGVKDASGSSTGAGKHGVIKKFTEIPQTARGTARPVNEAPSGTNSMNTSQKTASGSQTTTVGESANTSVSAKGSRDGSGAPSKGGEGKVGQGAPDGRPGASEASPEDGGKWTVHENDKALKAVSTKSFSGEGNKLGAGEGSAQVRPVEVSGPPTDNTIKSRAAAEVAAVRDRDAQSRANAADERRFTLEPSRARESGPGSTAQVSPRAGEVGTFADLGKAPAPKPEPFTGEGNKLGAGEGSAQVKPVEVSGPPTDNTIKSKAAAEVAAVRDRDAQSRANAADERRFTLEPSRARESGPGSTAQVSPRAGEVGTIADLGKTPTPKPEPFTGEGNALGKGEGSA